MPKKRIALLDGDVVAHRCGFACERTTYTLKYSLASRPEAGSTFIQTFNGKRLMNAFLKKHGDQIIEYEWSSDLHVEPLNYCLSTVKHMVNNIIAAGKATDYEVFMSDSDNFRHDIATIAEYKGNRKMQRKPMWYGEIVKYLKESHGAVSFPRLEADDVLADKQLAYNAEGIDTYIASVDKDLLQIPGKHYDLAKEELTLITPEEGLYRLHLQVLQGDTTDNIPGIKGVGPVKAKEVLLGKKTEEQLMSACIEQWTEYLTGDHKPDWVTDDTDVEDVVTQVKALLTVGTPEGFEDGQS